MDEKFEKVINKIRDGFEVRDFQFKSDVLIKGKRNHIHESRLIVLTREITHKLFLEIHEMYAYIGPKKCVKLFEEDFYFPG